MAGAYHTVWYEVNIRAKKSCSVLDSYALSRYDWWMPHANREERAAYARRYRAANAEKLREYDRVRRVRDPEKKLLASRKYREANREKLNAAMVARSAPFYERVNAAKLASGCVDCGYRAHAAALDFDHLPGFTKVTDISRLKYRPWAEVEAEMTKCEVVCSNCHRIRTVRRRSVREPLLD